MAMYLNNEANNKPVCSHLPAAEARQPLIDIGQLMVENSLSASKSSFSEKYKSAISEIVHEELCDRDVFNFKLRDISVSRDVQALEAGATFCLPDTVNEEESTSEENSCVFSFEEELDMSDISIPENVTQFYECEDEETNGSPMLWDDSQDSVNLSWSARKNNLYDCVEYSKDVYGYLREVEAAYQPQPSYMTNQFDINFRMRSILVDWMVEVARLYEFQNETLYLSVSLVDRFLSVATVLRDYLQLVGIASVFIAAKYEETFFPDIEEFVYLTDETYSVSQVLHMEQLILTSLDFRINAPSAPYFLQYVRCATGLPNNVFFLAQYLSELTLLDVEAFLPYMPSQIAAAAISLSSYTMGYEAWDAELEQTTGYMLQDLQNVIECLYVAYRRAPHNLHQTIMKKYRSNEYNGVSSIHPAEVLSCF